MLAKQSALLPVGTQCALANLAALMRQDLLKGTRNLCIGYTTDASFHTRRALEAAASILHLLDIPSLAGTWSKLDTESDVKQYTKDFAVFKLVKEKLSACCLSLYEQLCLSVHPSAMSMAHRVGVDEDQTLEIRLFDIGDENPETLRMEFINLLSTHALVLNDLACALAKDSADDCTEWQKAYDMFWAVRKKHPIDTELVAHQNRDA